MINLIRNLVLILSLSLIMAACAPVTISPNKIRIDPNINLDLIGTYEKKLSVNLINNQPDSTIQPIPHPTGKFRVNYNEWTQFYIEQWEEELIKRGVNVSGDSPNLIKVKIYDIEFFGKWELYVRMMIELEDKSGTWSKKIKSISMDNWTGKGALINMFTRSIEKLLEDIEVIDKMRMDDS